MSAKTISVNDSYVDKAAKLIPAEVVTLFVAASSMVSATNLPAESMRFFNLAVAAVCGLVLVPLVLHKLYSVSVKEQTGQHVVAVLGFMIWVFNVGYDKLPVTLITDQHTYAQLTGALVLMLFTFASPLIIKGQAP